MLIGKIILKNSYSTLSNAILKLSRYDFNSIILKKNFYNTISNINKIKVGYKKWQLNKS